MALLDDGLLNTDALLHRVGELLKSEHGVEEIVYRLKPNLSLPAPLAMLEELRANVDYAVVGVGG